MGTAETIDEVIEQLTAIIDRCVEDELRLGYFAALYRKVTVEVKTGIAEGFFDDGARMERLDVIFANRYLTAYDAHRAGRPTTEAWAYAFEIADQWWPIVLQHLLLGMNAHINLDLGVAAAKTVPADELPNLHGDFNRINDILSRLVAEVKEELAEIWWTLRLFNRYLGSVEDAIINFSMTNARDAAWDVALRLAPMDDEERGVAIAALDADVRRFGRVIRHPGVLASTVLKTVRLGERGSVRRKIEILS